MIAITAEENANMRKKCNAPDNTEPSKSGLPNAESDIAAMPATTA
jgi:hypothetical protein